MPRITNIAALLALLGVCGCVAPKADSRVVGTYTAAHNSESLTILPDTRVYYARTAGGREQRVLIGYAARRSSSPPGSLSIIAPDTSPFVGTALQVSDDFRAVTVQWHNFRDPKEPRQKQFGRSDN